MFWLVTVQIMNVR